MAAHGARGTSSTAPITVTIAVARLIRLRPDETKGTPRRVVAHLEVQLDGRRAAVFGQVDLHDSHEEIHLRGRAWQVAEGILDGLIGQRDTGQHSAGDAHTDRK